MMPIVSVIVPVYNIENYIEKCIKSILMQTYTKLEIILLDDGSSDSSGSICDEYANKDSRIKVIHKKNEGIVKARKDGLKASTGEYIAYVDGDDWIEPNMIERMYTILDTENVDIAMCGRYEDTVDFHRPVYHGIKPGRYDKEALVSQVYPNMIVNGAFFEWGIFPGVWDKLFKRECLEPFQMAVDNRLTMGEDAACTYPALLNANSIYIMNECLYHYRQTGTSMVKQNVDVDLQRERFSILYNSVIDSFAKYRDIYDLRTQWLQYLLFLMVPRAGTLYRGIQELDYLFPFPKVKKGSKVIIYGMGTYGQYLYKYLNTTGFCDVLTCIDKNYVQLKKQGFPVESIDKICEYDYEAILIASSFKRTREAIYSELSKKYNENRIHIMDEDLVMSDTTLKSFGLI